MKPPQRGVIEPCPIVVPVEAHPAVEGLILLLLAVVEVLVVADIDGDGGVAHAEGVVVGLPTASSLEPQRTVGLR